MVSRSPRRGSGGGRDDAGRDPALDRVVRAARDTAGEMDTATLEATLAAYRVAGNAAPAAEPVPAVRVTRRHRVLRAVAATTIATKVVLGLATAAAIGGIGVAVTETVHRAPPPVVTHQQRTSGAALPGAGIGIGREFLGDSVDHAVAVAGDRHDVDRCLRHPEPGGVGLGVRADRPPDAVRQRDAVGEPLALGQRQPFPGGVGVVDAHGLARPDPLTDGPLRRARVGRRSGAGQAR